MRKYHGPPVTIIVTATPRELGEAAGVGVTGGWAHDGDTDITTLTLACCPDNRAVEEQAGPPANATTASEQRGLELTASRAACRDRGRRSISGFAGCPKRYEVCMAGTDEERQYLLARESDMWLDEAERIQNRLDDLDPGDDEDSDVLKDKVWLEYVLDKREELTEELLTMQGVLTDDDAVDIPMAVGD